jgi:hypothetical protein
MWNEKLRKAYLEGIISQEVCEKLIQWNNSKSEKDQEKVKFISGLNDILIILASYLVLGAGATVLGTVNLFLAVLFIVVASWLLSMHFLETKKVNTSEFAFLLAFTVSAAFLPYAIVQNKFSIPFVGILGIVAALVHFNRFNTRAALALAHIGLLVFGLGTLELFPIDSYFKKILSGLFTLSIGIFTIKNARSKDKLDPSRTMQISDQAFWLHLVGSPMIVHSIYHLIQISTMNKVGSSILFFLVYVVLVVISLGLNRRALMVSSTGYAIFAFSKAISLGRENLMSNAISALLIGGLMLVLAIKWNPIRENVLQFFGLSNQNK